MNNKYIRFKIQITILFSLLVLVPFAISGEILFEVKDNSENTIMSVQDDGIWIMNSIGDTLMTVNNDSIRFGIDNAMQRSFAIQQSGSRKDKDRSDVTNVMKISPESSISDVVNYPTMLWYPTKNAFRVNKVYIQHADSVGDGSIATGFHSQAKGTYSTAMGDSTRATGYSSFAAGVRTSATGHTSLALGNSTVASGPGSYAIGLWSVASGSGSFAMGTETNATAYGSTTMGWRTRADAVNSLVIGRLNIVEGNPLHWDGGEDPVFVVGNGYEGITGTVRRNALTVRQNGNVDIGGTLAFESGTSIDEFSTDGNLAGDSDDAVPTEKAVRSYVDSHGPIAMGNVSSQGGINSGSGNFTAAWDDTNSRYVISISGETYYYTSYITNVTPMSSGASARTSSGSGKLYVYITNSSGSPIQSYFQFITYKP